MEGMTLGKRFGAYFLNGNWDKQTSNGFVLGLGRGKAEALSASSSTPEKVDD